MRYDIRQPSYAASAMVPAVASPSTGTLVAFIVAGWVLVWVVPAMIVAARATGNGLPALPFFLVAFFLGWPVALLVDVALGQRSPLVRALERQDPEPPE
jgi:hypothetical protein